MQFSGVNKDGREVAYTDKKRWLWFSPLGIIAVCLAAYWLYFKSGENPLLLAMPIFVVFVVLPLVDAIVGEDTSNPPHEVITELSDDPYYSWVAYLLIPGHYALFIATVWMVGTQDIPFWAIVMLAFGVATINGNMINIGHELGHKTDQTNKTFAKLALSLSGYGHFTIEHNRGHHVHVATPEDCASARMGESVYAFALREWPGVFWGAWSQERKRLSKKGLSLWNWQNEILQVYALNIIVVAALVSWLGWSVLPFILAHHLISWYALTQINYIEHYGLKRQKKGNGRYEPCEPHHSWNSNHVVSNLVLLHLQRHSDHHANPMRPYQALRDYSELPRLPSGYPGCMVLAAIPPLWFKVMDPMVMDWADGDISKVNVCPRANYDN